MKKRKYTLQQIAEGLREGCGIITEAARLVGCDRQTIYNWMRRHPELEEIRDEGEEIAKDVAEASLLALIRSLNVPAILFFLKCKAKDRGYIERRENVVMGRDRAPLQLIVEWADTDSFSAKDNDSASSPTR